MRDRGHPCPWCRGGVKWRTDTAAPDTNIVPIEEIVRRIAAPPNDPPSPATEGPAAQTGTEPEDPLVASRLAADEAAARLAADEEFARMLAANMVGAAPILPPVAPELAAAPEEGPIVLPPGIKQVGVSSADESACTRR
jgi:hypothetical protein